MPVWHVLPRCLVVENTWGGNLIKRHTSHSIMILCIVSHTHTHTHIHRHTRSLSLSSVGVCLFSSNWSVSYANLFPDVFYNCQIGTLMLSLFCSQQFIAAVSGVLYVWQPRSQNSFIITNTSIRSSPAGLD